jgi:hypothetical protein
VSGTGEPSLNGESGDSSAPPRCPLTPPGAQQAPTFWAQKLWYFCPLEPAEGGDEELGAAVPPAAVAVPSLEAPPVPPPVPVVADGLVDVVPVVDPVPVEAVVPAVPVVPVDPVPEGVAVAVADEPADAVGVGVAVPLESALEPLAASAVAEGPAPLGTAIETGGPGTSGAAGLLPPQPASATARRQSSRAGRAERIIAALSAAGRTSGGRTWDSR